VGKPEKPPPADRLPTPYPPRVFAPRGGRCVGRTGRRLWANGVEVRGKISGARRDRNLWRLGGPGGGV